MQVFNYIDTIIVFVIPFTLIVVLNTFTTITVWKFDGVRRSMTMQKRLERRFGGFWWKLFKKPDMSHLQNEGNTSTVERESSLRQPSELSQRSHEWRLSTAKG